MRQAHAYEKDLFSLPLECALRNGFVFGPGIHEYMAKYYFKRELQEEGVEVRRRNFIKASHDGKSYFGRK